MIIPSNTNAPITPKTEINIKNSSNIPIKRGKQLGTCEILLEQIKNVPVARFHSAKNN